MVALLALKNITKHNNVFHHSLELAQKGFYVLPLSPNSKIPLKGTNGCKDATRDEATIVQWIEAHPHSNIGIATGKEQGYFVLDIDVGDGKYGEDSLAELERTYGKLPDTVETKTQSGGRHLYFNYPQDAEIPCSAGKLGTNLDLRSDGGYCVAAPSTIDGKTYEWEGSSDPF